MTAIEVQELSVFVGSQRLLGPVSFSVSKGETLVIMGETGAGKSLIAQAILGTLPLALHMEGTIAINGRRIGDLADVDRASLWGREITMLPQEPWRALDPLMVSGQQVTETHQYVARLSPMKAREATTKDLADLGLTEAERRLPGKLSGGMAQRFAFATATAGRAPILLADEPTKGLDSLRRELIVSLLCDVPKTSGTLVAITHECLVARELGGKLIVLKEGQVVEQGKTNKILAKPRAEYTKQLIAADPVSWTKSEPGKQGNALLSTCNLNVSRGGNMLIRELSFTLHAGERLAISGPSGVGKTSLLDTLAGLLKPSAGQVERAPDLGPHDVQKLYQDPPAAFPPHVPLGVNLRDIAQLHGTSWEQVMTYYSQLGLHSELLERTPDAVSGGELQRVSIARALIVNPKVLLADEPTSRLDPITQRETLELIEKISRENNIAVVLITHSYSIANKWADRTISLA